jgi:hypothetical protein
LTLLQARAPEEAPAQRPKRQEQEAAAARQEQEVAVAAARREEVAVAVAAARREAVAVAAKVEGEDADLDWSDGTQVNVALAPERRGWRW